MSPSLPPSLQEDLQAPPPSLSAPASRLRRHRGLALRLVGLVAGAGVVAWLVRGLGGAHILGYLRHVGPGFLLVLAAYLAANVVYALPLGAILPQARRPSLWQLVAGRLGAVAVNALTPLGPIGGEPARLLWLAPDERRLGLAALFVDRAAFYVASALFLCCGTGLGLLVCHLPRPALVGLVVTTLVAPVAAVALWLRQRGGGVAGPVARVLAIFVGRGERRTRLTDGARTIDDDVRRLHVERPHAMARAVTLHFLGRLVAASEVYVAARLVGMAIDPAGALVLAAVPLAVDMVLAFVPSQVGFQEGATALVAGALGFDPAAGVAVSLLQRVRQCVVVAVSFVLLSLRRTPPAAAAKVAPAAPPAA